MHLDIILDDFFNQINNQEIISLIGASGPFEILEAMGGMDVKSNNTLSNVEVQRTINNVIYLPLNERLQIPSMPKNRADLSVESLLLINYLLEKIPSIVNIKISPYALKEGLIFDMI